MARAFKNRFLLIICFSLSLSVSGALAFGGVCEDIKAGFDQRYGVHAIAPELKDALKAAGVPAMVKKTNTGGEVLAILVNGASVDKLTEVLKSSMGTMTQFQPDWHNDHGMLRVGTKLIDVDTPGARGYGEREMTGIAWKEITLNTKRRDRNPDDSVRIEVMYSLKPEEMKTAELYHRVRASAMFRVPFTFGGGDPDLTLPNTITEGGEHCYIFCKATAVSSHISAIGRQITGMTGRQSATEVVNSPDGTRFINAATAAILGWQVEFGAPSKADAFSYTALGKVKEGKTPIISWLKPLLPAKAKNADLLKLGNWLMGYHASVEYQGLVRQLGISGDSTFRDMNNPRASAILIYDPNPAATAAFRNGTYQTAGKFGAWTNTGQTALGAANTK